MLSLGFGFVISLESVIVISIIFLCKSEISEKRRQVSLRFKVLFHHAEKRDTARRKLQKARRAYTKERLNQREQLGREMSRLDKLLCENSINEDTYARYKKLLEIINEEKRQQTRKKCRFAKDLTPTV
jgi:hypothetical protein